MAVFEMFLNLQTLQMIELPNWQTAIAATLSEQTTRPSKNSPWRYTFILSSSKISECSNKYTFSVSMYRSSQVVHRDQDKEENKKINVILLINVRKAGSVCSQQGRLHVYIGGISRRDIHEERFKINLSYLQFKHKEIERDPNLYVLYKSRIIQRVCFV